MKPYLTTTFLLMLSIGDILAANLRQQPKGQKFRQHGVTVSPKTLLVDDYSGAAHTKNTRFGSNRGAMGSGVQFSDDHAAVNITGTGWGGVYTSLSHTVAEKRSLDFRAPLGPAIRAEYQPTVTGIQIRVLEGAGKFKVVLKNTNNKNLFAKTVDLDGAQVLQIPVAVTEPVHLLNWVVSGPGHVIVDEIRLMIHSPSYSVSEAVFLWSYANLYTTYDPDSGLTRDRARTPSEQFSSVQTMGTFALATALALDLGYLKPDVAETIIVNVRDALSRIPRHESGLLPHFLKNGVIIPGSEFSSIDTVISLVSMILACELVGIDAFEPSNHLRSIDWDSMTENGTKPVSHGFRLNEATGVWDVIPWSWGTFGSESWLIALAVSSVKGSIPIVPKVDTLEPKTWNGSGFNDWMAVLFFDPQDRPDVFGVNWQDFLISSTSKQLNFHSGTDYEGLFGHSAAEVPEPWASTDNAYGPWGTGGYAAPKVTSPAVGTPIFTPHYWAMIMADYPSEAEAAWIMLIEKEIFTPLNNVECFTATSAQLQTGDFTFNTLRGSWNLSLQTLGAARALYKVRHQEYPVYGALESDLLLGPGLDIMLAN